MESPWIYFAQDTHTQVIKIGKSADPFWRVGSLQTASPYTIALLGCVQGGHDIERKLHRRFRKYRLRREWFSRDISAKVKMLLARRGSPLPPVVLADWDSPTITIEKATDLLGLAPDLPQWVVKYDVPTIKCTNGLVFAREVMQAFFHTNIRTENEDYALLRAHILKKKLTVAA